MKHLLTICFLSLIQWPVFSQQAPISLDQKILQSDLIVEGSVMKKTVFKFNDQLYTLNKIKVCKVYFATSNYVNLIGADTLNIVTYGGQKDGYFEMWSHMLQLNLDKEGLFFLKPNPQINQAAAGVNAPVFDVYCQEQGFYEYAKSQDEQFKGTALYDSFRSFYDLAGRISSLHKTKVEAISCLLNDKSGITLRIDTIYNENHALQAQTSIKSHWSKQLKLNNIDITLKLASPVTLNSGDLLISSNNTDINTNYIAAWNQTNLTTVVISLHKTPQTNVFFQAASNFNTFLKISINPGIFTSTSIQSVAVTQADFSYDGISLPIHELEIENNKFFKQISAAPTITSVSPNDVAAGVKADLSSGNPVEEGYVIIKGTNFGTPNIATEVPNKYRVMFTREQEIGNSSFRVSPLREDYVYWNDTEIKVRVPTVGWLYNNSNQLNATPEQAVSVTGKVFVRTPDGTATSPNDLIVNFAHFNFYDASLNANSSFPYKMYDVSGNGGYRLTFDPSFNDIYPPSPTAARQDVLDALCEWNMHTGVKIEVVPTCPPGSTCFKVKYANIPNNPGTGTVVLARGIANPSGLVCPNEALITAISMTYNNDPSLDWRPKSFANPFDQHVILPTAYHEVGHILSQGHTYNTGATMHPSYTPAIIIDNNAIGGGTHLAAISAALVCSGINTLQLGPQNCLVGQKEALNDCQTNIYPTVASSSIQLDICPGFSPSAAVIMDAAGREIKRMPLTEEQTFINVADLKSGLYWVVLSNNGLQWTGKFIKI